jgi:hypothetical protein
MIKFSGENRINSKRKLEILFYSFCASSNKKKKSFTEFTCTSDIIKLKALLSVFYEDITDKAKGLFPIWSSIQDQNRI